MTDQKTKQNKRQQTGQQIKVSEKWNISESEERRLYVRTFIITLQKYSVYLPKSHFHFSKHTILMTIIELHTCHLQM